MPSSFTFLDPVHLGEVAVVVSQRRQVGHLHLGRGQEGGGARGGVVEDGGAVALPTAFPPVAVDSCLKLAGGAQPPLFTFVWVEVLHVPAAEEKRNSVFTCHRVTLSHVVNHSAIK